MITITPEAAEKLKGLIAEENSGTEIPESAGLRIYVQGGGCSGFQYGLMIEKVSQESDQIFESNGIRIFVDIISIRYLDNSVIEFVNDIDGGGFKITNPNATSTCGCGQSFNTEQ